MFIALWKSTVSSKQPFSLPVSDITCCQNIHIDNVKGNVAYNTTTQT